MNSKCADHSFLVSFFLYYVQMLSLYEKIFKDYNSRSRQCAQIDRGRGPELLVPDSTNASITFPVVNMGAHLGPLFCAFSGGPSPVRVSAMLAKDRVHCSTSHFYYDGQVLKIIIRALQIQFIIFFRNLNGVLVLNSQTIVK
jgi:hypothetical protein